MKKTRLISLLLCALMFATLLVPALALAETETNTEGTETEETVTTEETTEETAEEETVEEEEVIEESDPPEDPIMVGDVDVTGMKKAAVRVRDGMRLRLRAEADSDSAVLINMPTGSTVYLTGNRSGAWREVVYLSKAGIAYTGYAYGGYLR